MTDDFDSMKYCMDESLEKLAAGWQMLGSLRLIDSIFNHISVSFYASDGSLSLAMNPNGFLPEEVDAKALKTLPLRMYSIEEAIQSGVNPDGLRLHAQVHLARGVPGCIVHTHSANVVAVSCSERGLLPLSQTAIEFCGDLVFIDYEGLFRGHHLDAKLVGIAQNGGVCLLRNHGMLAVTSTIEEAVYIAYYLEESCRIQIKALSMGGDLVMPSVDAIEASRHELLADRTTAATLFFNALNRTRSLRRSGHDS
jgi:ribulose-5-phosphate 4-epimerase/fuculose-1-phosphate aldolase